MKIVDITMRLLRDKAGRRYAADAFSAIIKSEHADQIDLMEFSQNAQQWTAFFGSKRGEESVVARFVEGIGRFFAEHGGQNYLEFSMYHPAHGPLTLTIQRAQGKTPAQKAADAEQRLHELLEQDTTLRSRADRAENLLNAVVETLKDVLSVDNMANNDRPRGGTNLVEACQRLAERVRMLEIGDQPE